MKRKICHVASHVSHSLFFEAIGEFLDKDKYEVSFVFLNPAVSPIQTLLAERGHNVEWIKYRSKKDLPAAIFQLTSLFSKMRPDIVHTHLLGGSLAGLTAARLCGIGSRVHTRHHSTECHVYYPHAVYYDRLVNRLSARIMATTKIVEEILVERENVPREKIRTIHLGYDLARFKSNEPSVRELREKYGLGDNHPIIGVVSRFVELKGVQYVIPAFAKLASESPRAKLVLANASGSYGAEIKRLLDDNLHPSQYVLIEFESKIFDLYKTFDAFVHVPVNRDSEAFGQTYLEALYMQVPSVFTLSGAAHDFIRDGENALVVPYRDSEAIYRSVKVLLDNETVRTRVTNQGKADVERLFGAVRLARDLDDFYSEM